jgi:polar amino acid transport system substrate-binding protein
MTYDKAAITALAPSGTLRASINTGNPILARVGDTPEAPKGVSVDLAHRLAEQLGLPLALVVFDSAGKSVEAVSREDADFGFFAVDPVRGEQVAFTSPYVLIEGSYLVLDESPLKNNAEVDKPGTRVAVGKGSAYDLYLTRELKAATIVRAPTSPTVLDTFIDEKLEVAAGVKQQLEAFTRSRAGMRLLPGRFMVIGQAMGCQRSRGTAAAALLSAFVEEAKESGFVAEALQRHRIEGASVAPAA